ncbi:MAG: hypothetical protein Kow0067_08070 [Coriobacteriia bacterium]
MPTYDYRCRNCDATFEINRPIGDGSAVCCPECGGETKRVFTPVGVVFKGSGFHNTDYRPSSESASDAATPPAPCSSAGSDGCASCPAASADKAS